MAPSFENGFEYHLFLPLHPAYFPEAVTIEELDWFEHGPAKLVCQSLLGLDNPPDIIMVRNPGKFVGVQFNQSNLASFRKEILKKLTPVERDELIAEQVRRSNQDYEVVKSNILHSIKQRRDARC